MAICWACKSDIKAGQKKCIECDSWQNWPLRMLAPIGIGGATLITLSSLIVLMKTEIIDRYFPSGPRLHFGGYYRISMSDECRKDREKNFDNLEKNVPRIQERCFRDGSPLTINVKNSGDRDATMPSKITCLDSEKDGFDWHIVSAQNIAPGEQMKIDYRETPIKFELGIDKFTEAMGVYNCMLRWTYGEKANEVPFLLEAFNGNVDGAVAVRPLVF